MSFYAQAYSMRERAFQPTVARPSRKRSFNITLIDLVRPECYWPQPLTIEQAFELFRWMVKTGDGYSTKERWGTRSVFDLLGATSGIGHSTILPVRSLADLRTRFHYAILGRAMCEGQAKWREDFRISPLETLTIRVPTYRPFEGAAHLGWNSEAEIQKGLVALCDGSHGKRMAVSLNCVHKDKVNWLHHVSIGVSPTGFSFNLTYGEKPIENRGVSQWNDCIARGRPGESFLDTMARARDVFDCLVNGTDNGADCADLFAYPGYGDDFVQEQIAAL